MPPPVTDLEKLTVRRRQLPAEALLKGRDLFLGRRREPQPTGPPGGLVLFVPRLAVRQGIRPLPTPFEQEGTPIEVRVLRHASMLSPATDKDRRPPAVNGLAVGQYSRRRCRRAHPLFRSTGPRSPQRRRRGDSRACGRTRGRHQRQAHLLLTQKTAPDSDLPRPYRPLEPVEVRPGPGQWLPPAAEVHCRYVAGGWSTNMRWTLSADRPKRRRCARWRSGAGPDRDVRAGHLQFISFGVFDNLSPGVVERLVPDELWELFQRVVPEAPTRPQGGGRRRHGGREVLAAIVFVATSGCTWQQLPSASFGLRQEPRPTAGSREWSKARVWAKLHRLVLDELGVRGQLDWSRCAIDSVNMRALKGGADRSESCGPGQVRLEDPLDHRAVRSAPVRRYLRCQRPRQSGPDPARAGHTADPFPARTTTAQTGQAPRRQGLRLQPPAAMVTRPTHHTPGSPARGIGLQPAAGPAPLDRRTHHGLARRIPTPPPTLRTQGEPLPWPSPASPAPSSAIAD